MSGVLVAVLSLLALVVVVWAVVLVARDRRVGRATLVALGVLEVAVLAVAVDGFAALASGTRPVETATSVAYLVVAPFVVPAGTFWALADRSRPSTLVLAVAAFAVIVIAYRAFLLFAVTK
ncbi:hypothetical protein [Kineococcus rhizosphaerae]|uniref:Integral membrane protein n=1 Tax=Kineococcus rhizosphaerae TaxID=559628 RepID=A0A2T0QWX5_9ACTN|nr:hypothetical protein [Kineococcus rhizosphaerae]PRY10073.1 hypothetical protein CLV37_11843 [Kineococcus rhizosphaerae]